MPRVHPTAIIEGEVKLADDVEIGPHCVLTGPVTIGPGTRLIGNVWLQGPLTLGENNLIYPFACLGFAPQDLKWDPARPGAGVHIGSANVIREGVTIHRATTDQAPTRIGDRNYWMGYGHAGHDCTIGNDCIFANCTMLGGFVRMDDRVITGGTATVHQFCHVGRGALLSGVMGLSRDLPPWFMMTGTNLAGSINLIGLRRSGASEEIIQDVRWVYKTLYRRGMSIAAAIEAIRERAGNPIIDEYLEFFASSKRGICPAKADPARGIAAEI